MYRLDRYADGSRDSVIRELPAGTGYSAALDAAAREAGWESDAVACAAGAATEGRPGDGWEACYLSRESHAAGIVPGWGVYLVEMPSED